MSREKVAILGIALAFYAVGGWSLYGEFHRRQAHEAGKWESTDAMITAAYAQDFREHELVPKSLLGYRYVARGVEYEVNKTFSQKALANAFVTHHALKVRYKPEDPAVAMLAGDPDDSNDSNFSLGLGLIGFGTLTALCRELVLRRRGKFRGDAMPLAWQELHRRLK